MLVFPFDNALLNRLASFIGLAREPNWGGIGGGGRGVEDAEDGVWEGDLARDEEKGGGARGGRREVEL